MSDMVLSRGAYAHMLQIFILSPFRSLKTSDRQTLIPDRNGGSLCQNLIDFIPAASIVSPSFTLKPTNAAFVMHHVLTATLRGLLIHFVHNASAHTLLTVVRAGAFALDVPPGMLSFDRFSRRSPAPNSIHAQTLTLPSQFARGSPLLYSRGCWHRH